MKRFDNKELYLYGTLVALFEEQVEAIDKLTDGRLGMWGKSRLGARNREIDKILDKILAHKRTKLGTSFDASSELQHDLESIRTGALGRRYSDGSLRFFESLLSQF